MKKESKEVIRGIKLFLEGEFLRKEAEEFAKKAKMKEREADKYYSQQTSEVRERIIEKIKELNSSRTPK